MMKSGRELTRSGCHGRDRQRPMGAYTLASLLGESNIKSTYPIAAERRAPASAAAEVRLMRDNLLRPSEQDLSVGELTWSV